MKDKLHDLKDWLERKWCAAHGHRRGKPEEVCITNHYDGKEYYSEFVQCDYCGEVLKPLYNWTVPEGTRVIFPGAILPDE